MRESHYTLWALAAWLWPSLEDCIDQLKFEQVVLKNTFILLGDYESESLYIMGFGSSALA